MNLKEKCILPLVNTNLTESDISSQQKFVGIYFGDINKPYIENCIFLMYEYDNSLCQYNLTKKLKSFDNLYTTYVTQINNICYRVFVFTMQPNEKQDILFLKKGYFNNISMLHKYRILKFFVSDPIVFYTLFSNERSEEMIYIIPEEDYKVSIMDHFTTNAKSPVV